MNTKKSSTILKSTLLAGTLVGAGALTANAEGLFEYTDLGSGSEIRADLTTNSSIDLVSANELSCGEGKCGEGKCGESKGDKKTDATKAADKASEGKCGESKGESKDATKDAKEDKAGEGKCGEGKCGEGKCGEE